MILILHIKVLNSHNQYKDLKAMKKIHTKLITHVNNTVICNLFMKLLNNTNLKMHRLK